jgi:hypothetical protein
VCVSCLKKQVGAFVSKKKATPIELFLLFLFLVAPESTTRSRSEINRDIDADYYGYRDEEDEVLLEYEKALEKELIDKLFNAPDEETAIDEKQPKHVEPTHQDEMTKKANENTEPAVPSQKEVEAYLLQRRKQQVESIKRLFPCLQFTFFFLH